MKYNGSIALALALVVSACSDKEDAPSGQVVATVDGQEITLADLRAEMGPEASGGDTAQAEALERIIARKLLAAEARKQKLDSTPLAAIIKTQAEETALAQLLARKVTDGVPKISEDEVSEFLRTFPASVTDRRLLSVEQLIVPALPPKVFEALRPVTSLEAAEELLKVNKVPYRRTVGNMDTAAVDPGYAQQLAATEGNNIFIIPRGQSAEIGRVLSSRADPIGGSEARQAARLILTRQRTAEQVNNALGRVVSEGRRKVQVNPQFRGKAAPVAPAAATGQVAAATPG